ncbi:TRAP transporter small permease subunit [Rhodobacterales bacterium HKCCE2091]|nr:TRAP transporter small permease subunit [Rhodobacterales bacterium HKCCE2091]
MASLYRILHGITRASVWIFGAGYLLIALATTLDVAMRNIWGRSLPGVYEYSGYIFAIATTWGFAYVLFERAHVRIDVAYQRLGAGLRAVLDLLSLVAMGAFAAVLCYRAWLTLDDTLLFSATARTTLQTPLWIPQSLWLAGLIWFLVCLVFMAVYVATLILRGRLAEVSAIAGIPHVTAKDGA